MSRCDVGNAPKVVGGRPDYWSRANTAQFANLPILRATNNFSYLLQIVTMVTIRRYHYLVIYTIQRFNNPNNYNTSNATKKEKKKQVYIYKDQL